MNYIITLILNETGKKAIGISEKTLQVDADITDINSEYIDKLFPMSLVENFYVVPSFLNLKEGDYVYVVNPDGERFLGCVDNGCYSKKLIFVRTESPSASGHSTFHADGIETGHYKNKWHLENITPEDVEKEKNKIENEPYTRLVKLLLDSNLDNVVKISDETLKLPEWLSNRTLYEIIDMLEYDLNEYFYNK